MGGGEDEVPAGAASSNPAAGAARRPYWRSQSWTASRSSAAASNAAAAEAAGKASLGGGRPFAAAPGPLTPRSQQNCKARSCLPPLQPLSIARRSVDEWPMAGSDDVGEWPQPVTPGAKHREDLKVDISLLRTESKRNQIAFFDKECSKVADHIYLGGDAVARNREILQKNGITHVLNCVGFVCPEYFKSDLVYKTLWLQDSPSEDITSILYDVFDYFEDVRELGGRVLVHCCQGVSRSTSLVIAYLMWRKGQSFEDAFELVKSARGIANPNMGFACQLLQCQKRVHAIPLSPNSVLRMYRMAPHSPYDALHLVPKMLNEPSPSALDSRGAFILHVLSSIYVWVGNKCEPVMEKDAKAAAYQVVRYERVPGPILIVEEGEEPTDFWNAFLKVSPLSELNLKLNREQLDCGINIAVGKRRLESYDADFELFYKGLSGGVVPPFSSAGAGHETHLPARESNWSILRRKFISVGMKGWVSASKAAISRVYSDSMLAKRTDNCAARTQLLNAESPACPTYSSPSSVSSDFSFSSRSSTESPVVSPSTDIHSFTISPTLCNLQESIASSRFSHAIPNHQEPANVSSQAVPSPSKGLARSLAERRSFSPSLKLPSSANTSSKSTGIISDPTSTSHSIAQGSFSNSHSGTNDCNLGYTNNSERVLLGKSTSDNSESCRNAPESSILQEASAFCSTGSTIDDTKVSNPDCTFAYCWPDFRKLGELSHRDLDSKAVLIFLTPETGSISSRKLYIWVGSCFSHVKRWGEENGIKAVDDENGARALQDQNGIDWNQVGHDFLNSMVLPNDICIKVVRQEDEPGDFLGLLK